MKAEETLRELKEMGDPRAVKIWGRLGMNTENYYGAGLTKIKKYAKTIKKDHRLALELWDTGVHDARLLAVMIMDPKRTDENLLEKIGDDLDFWDLADNFCSYVAAKTPHAIELAEKWRHDRSEMKQRSCYMIISQMAKGKNDLSDDYFENVLYEVRKNIETSLNWVKEGMLYAVISIGGRNSRLNAAALKTARRVASVKIDYGETSCMQPDPLKILSSEKMLAKVNLKK